MSNVYFMSDPHWGHKAICKYRLFDTAEAHDELIFENVMSTIKKRDTLWILGDTCFTLDAIKYIREISSHAMKVNIVLGNHCTERGVTARDYLNAGDNISLYAIVSYHGFWLSHVPIHPQEMRNRKGNIHGHLHSTVVKDQYGHVDNKYRCVSMEHIQYTPMNFQDIKAEFNLEAK